MMAAIKPPYKITRMRRFTSQDSQTAPQVQSIFRFAGDKMQEAQAWAADTEHTAEVQEQRQQCCMC